LEQYTGGSSSPGSLAWVITIERQRGLCPACVCPDPQASERLESLRERGLQQISDELTPTTYAWAPGCAQCQSTGRVGEVAVFDVSQFVRAASGEMQEITRLSRGEYMLRLAARGQLTLEDILAVEAQQKHQLQAMLMEQEDAVAETQKSLRRRLVELEASNLVLQHRTEQLISLENISQMLIGLDDIYELASQVCRRLESLFGVNFAVLYQLASAPAAGPKMLEILAMHGWDSQLIGRKFPWHPAPEQAGKPNPQPYVGLPPGLTTLDLQPTQRSLPEGLKTGLLIPLVAQDGLVGIMVVQSSRKTTFSPGEQALLRTFANQTALALQRTRLLAARIEKEKLERELELARRLQQSLLPNRFPDIPGLLVSAASRAARWVGGDFYDVFEIDPEHLGIVIGDASDKGIPAALYMALTRSLILAEARQDASTERVLRRVNQHLLEMGELRGFITVFFGVFDHNRQTLDYTRAGHDRPVLIRNGHLQELDGGGMLLGVFPDAELELDARQIQLLPGDQLVLFTDGVMDVIDREGGLLPRSHLDEILLKFMPERDGCQALMDHLQQMQAGREQFDDMTLVCLTLAA
jgi:serine phosphatase RsbU (regulator of sigma subunit)